MNPKSVTPKKVGTLPVAGHDEQKRAAPDFDFPHVGQVFPIERESVTKKSGECSREIVLGMTSRTPQEASPRLRLLAHDGEFDSRRVTGP